ncbi:RNA-directed DNA polymerase [Providencia huaxiensis]|nr:RNA-directed DNA polymerase [Providencia huaxiensis]MBQ0586857.1 RNA-directed DNA polymerase [Providencia huaxiensis]
MMELHLAQKMPYHERYKEIELKKSSGDVRIVYNPAHLIRKIQKRINNRIFKPLILWPNYLFGSIPKNELDKKEGIDRHYIACARKHCEAKTILKVDIKNFFDNIHRDIVYDVFKKVLKYKGEALEYLVDICCFGDKIVQGALTSSYIASLCLFDLEFDIVKRAARKQLVYTRLVDDITVSSKIVNFDMSQMLNHIKNMLLNKDLPINEKKTQVHNISTESLTVHGLRISFATPRLPAHEVGRIRASIHNLEQLSKKNNSLTSVAYRLEYNRCVGRVNKLVRLNHNKKDEFKRRLKAILPKASKKDIKEITRSINFLESSYALGNSNKAYYKKKYDLTIYRLIILKRTPSYHEMEAEFRNRLLNIKY